MWPRAQKICHRPFRLLLKSMRVTKQQLLSSPEHYGSGTFPVPCFRCLLLVWEGEWERGGSRGSCFCKPTGVLQNLWGTNALRMFWDRWSCTHEPVPGFSLSGRGLACPSLTSSPNIHYVLSNFCVICTRLALCEVPELKPFRNSVCVIW